MTHVVVDRCRAVDLTGAKFDVLLRAFRTCHASVSPPTDNRSVDIVSEHRKPAQSRKLPSLSKYFPLARSAAGGVAEPKSVRAAADQERPAIAAHSGHAAHPLER